MDDVNVDDLELCCAPCLDLLSPGEGEWTEARMRDLLNQSLVNSIKKSIKTRSKGKSEYRLRAAADRLGRAVMAADSDAIIELMCDLTPLELEEVVAQTRLNLRREGLRSVDVRLDDFFRIVLFDDQKGRGVAMAPSGSYQRVSRFYDGSYRYGIEMLLDEHMKDTLDALFAEIKSQVQCA